MVSNSQPIHGQEHVWTSLGNQLDFVYYGRF